MTERGLKLDTFEKWREHVKENPTNSTHWQHAGDWFFPTPQNHHEIWQGKFFHMCEENWRRDTGVEEKSVNACKNSCDSCGLDIPNGIKMIAGLLTW